MKRRKVVGVIALGVVLAALGAAAALTGTLRSHSASAATLGSALPVRLAESAGRVRVVQAGGGRDIAAMNPQPGDIFELQGGSYTWLNVNGVHGTAQAPITIRPAAGASVLITGRVDFLNGTSYVRFTGEGGHVTIDGSSNEYDLNLRLITVSHVEVSFVEFKNCSQPLYGGHGSSDIHVLGNYIHDAGADANHEHGMYFGYGTNDRWVVAGNVVARTRARGLQFYSGTFRNGFVVNNTVVDAGYGNMGHTDGKPLSDTYGYALQVNPASRWLSMVVANNIVLNPKDAGYVTSNGTPSGGRFATNLGWGNPQRGGLFNWSGPTENNITADPKLDASFKPQAGSPAIGTAIPEYTPPYGVLGAPRSSSDLGAVPSGTTTPPPTTTEPGTTEPPPTTEEPPPATCDQACVDDYEARIAALQDRVAALDAQVAQLQQVVQRLTDLLAQIEALAASR